MHFTKIERNDFIECTLYGILIETLDMMYLWPVSRSIKREIISFIFNSKDDSQ